MIFSFSVITLLIANSITVVMNNSRVESVAGFTAGLTTSLLTHPLDLLKIRLQLSEKSPQTSPLKSILSNIQENSKLVNNSIYKEFYKGITPNLLGNVVGWSLYFTLYAKIKDLYPNETNNSIASNSIKFFGSSTISGVLTSLLTNPIWVLKTRLISENSPYKSTSDAIVRIYKTEGIRTFWSGSIPSLFQVFQNSLQFTIYDHIKSIMLLDSYKSQTYINDIQFYFIASSVSKFTSMLAMYPFQVLRSNMQKVDSGSFWYEFKSLYKQNGFYRGFTISVFKVLPATSITFVTYESMKIWLTRSEN